MPPFLRYAYAAFGWDRRGRIFRTPPGLRRSNGKEDTLGAAGKPARMHSLNGDTGDGGENTPRLQL